MALSGTIRNNVSNGYRLQLEWTGTQNISGNYTDVTASLYWMSTASWGVYYSGQNRTSRINIDGTWNSGSAHPSLNAGQKKRIHRWTRRINHNADGTGSFSLRGDFASNVTLNGTYFSTVSVGPTTFTLNRIPRASSITSSANWTAGNNRSVSISRNSTRFSHDVRWQVRNRSGSWVTVRTASANTSNTGSFTTAQNKQIFELLDGRSSADTRITIQTKDGSTNIGALVTKTGTVTAPRLSRTLSSSYSYTIEEGTNIGISRANANFHHKAEFTFGSFTKTVNTNASTTAIDLNPTAAQINQLYDITKNVQSIRGSVRLYTYYEGVQVRSSNTTPVTLRVVNAAPTFSSSDISYRDTLSSTVGLTGSNQLIIQGKSNLRVFIDNAARANKGASITGYRITANGVTMTRSTAGYVTIGTVDASSNISISVRATDSRGFTTTVSTRAIIIPYTVPNVISRAQRVNNFEDNTTISIRGSFSRAAVDGITKNKIKQIRYRIKRADRSTWEAYTNVPFTQNTSNGTFTTTDRVRSLDNTHAWHMQIVIDDELSTLIVDRTIGSGKPLFFIDADKESVGVNTFPNDPSSLEVAGNIRAQEQIIVSVGDEGSSNYGLQFEDTGNIISYWSGGITVYGNASTGNALFRVRGHENNSGYGTDFLIYNSGNARFYHDLAVNGRHTVDGGIDLTNRNANNQLTWGNNARLGRNDSGWDWVGRMDAALRFLDSGSLETSSSLAISGQLDVGRINKSSGDNYMYLRTESSGLRVTELNTTTTYRPVRASAFNTSSLAEYKEDIHEWKHSALDAINNATIYEYYLKGDTENGVYKKRQGLVIGEGYNAPTGIIDGDGVDNYRMASWSWKAIQELSAEKDDLEGKVNALEETVSTQAAAISELTTMMQEMKSELEALKR